MVSPGWRQGGDGVQSPSLAFPFLMPLSLQRRTQPASALLLLPAVEGAPDCTPALPRVPGRGRPVPSPVPEVKDGQKLLPRSLGG